MTWGVLVAREEQRREELDARTPALWAQVSREKLRSWLR
jgi:hypothetical protein